MCIFTSTLDNVPVDKKVVYVSHVLFGVYTVFSGLGIIFALGILIFNLAFAKIRLLQSYLLHHPLLKLFLYRVVKLSSPYLNVMIIMGAILFYIDVILFGVDEGIGSPFTTNSLCMVLHTIACCCICNLF